MIHLLILSDVLLATFSLIMVFLTTTWYERLTFGVIAVILAADTFVLFSHA